MKQSKNLIFFVVILLILASTAACAPKKESQKQVLSTSNNEVVTIQEPTMDASTVSKKLREFGFYVFDKPEPIPNFPEIPNLNNEANLSTKSYTGTITLLNFWATWCPPCKREMPSIENLYAATQDTNFRIVAVSVGETRSTVDNFIKKEKYSFPIYLDEKGILGGTMATQGIPTTYIVNKQGYIIAGTVGGRDYDDPAFISFIKELALR